MRKFNLYLSGLYFDCVDLDDQDFSRFSGIFHVDFARLAASIHQLEQRIKAASDAGESRIETSLGDIFQYSEDGLWVQRDKKFPWDLTVDKGEIIGITIPAREKVAVLVKAGHEDATILKAWQEYGAKEYRMAEPELVEIPMSDGIKLSGLLMLPQGKPGQTFPTILLRTPYGKETLQEGEATYVRRGYAVLAQDVRGRNQSEGAWEPMVHEGRDGDCTLDWIADQPWSDGNVGMLGGSYLGYVQWAASGTGNPHLKALASFVTAGSPFGDLPRKGGTLSSGTLAWAFALSQKKFNPERMIRDDWEQVLSIRPLTDICPKTLGHQVPFVKEWFENPDDCGMWQSMDWTRNKAHMKAPALIVSGWYDDNGMGTTEALDMTEAFQQGQRKIILGPWTHSGNSNRDLHGKPLGNNALRYDIDLQVLKWFDYHLKGADNGIEKTPMVEYYTIGEDCWKTAENWPIPDTEEKTLYLGSNGRLLEQPEQQSGQDAYLSDPKNPTPYLVDVSENEFGVPGNYKDVDLREDVLVYETSPLAEALTVTGEFHIDFYGSSSCPDTDWIVKVEHVDLQGNAGKMADGLLAARYRKGFDQPELMQAGQIYEFSIRTGKISETLPKGHKLRCTVTSGAEGLIFPNSNTAEGYNSIVTAIAENQIYFGGDYPSKIQMRVER